MNEKKPKKLYGNKARIDITKRITPNFENYVINDYRVNRYGGVISRLEDDAEFSKEEVDDNKK